MSGPEFPAGPAGGGPAPGPLHLVQSFANTLGTVPGMDLLRSREEAGQAFYDDSASPAARLCSAHAGR